ncbi:type II secretion system secretin GspD [Desulfospira joergensenii]|uniref:type II secretion system secretin GspD n=1 Tax=Desulfospira joergensenii TaxID=53329 RepID=UPI0004199A54|nr:type II secretion system secretin GspD [Desulfospira joergensenii]
MCVNRRLVLPIFLLLVLCAGFSGPGSYAADPPEQESGQEADPVIPEQGNSKYVSIDFNNVDINVFIKFMSKLTGKNFVVDSRVKGNVTIISPTKISVADAYKVFQSVLDINGFSTVESGKVIKIIPTPKAKADNLDTRIVTGPGRSGSLDDRIVTRLVPLEYASSDQIKNLFTPLVPKGSVVLSYADTNMLIITATLSSIDRLLKIVEAIDVQSIGQKISVIPVQYADASKMVQNLSSIFTARTKRTKTKQSTDMAVKFVADERTNSVILLASKVETEKIKSLIALLDQEVPRGEEKIRVYYLEHAIAEDLVKVLTEIPSDKSSQKTTTGQKKAPILSTSIKILADKATNSLIIMADKEDYPVLEEVISKLDIPRAMVYIECLIMEVNVTRGLNIGTEWQAGNDFDGGNRAVVGGFGGTGDSGFSNLNSLSDGKLAKGFSVGVLGKEFSIGGVTFPDISAVVNAYQSDEDVNIISTPQILTMENEEASITVGKNVPYQTRSAAESGTDTYSSYEYKDVGITLKITPQISKDRLVRLNVYQELTKLTSASGETSNDRPTTLKRQIETTIIVEDANSVVIGGLIDESVSVTEAKTPCLGSVPVIGWAFKNVNEGKEKTNLYVFLTPKVVKNPLEAGKIYQEKRKDINSLKKGEIILYDKLNRLGKDKKE